MDELDRYLKIEDRDADYRRYQVRAHGSDLFKKIALVVRSWFRSRSETPARTDSTLGLAYGELSVWKVRHPVTLTCLEGNLWLTRTGDPKDYLLKAGESMTLKSARGSFRRWIPRSSSKGRP